MEVKNFDEYKPRERRDLIPIFNLQAGDNPVVLLENKFVEVKRHFHEGQAVVCVPNCSLCKKGIPVRRAFFFYVFDEVENKIKILRVGRQVMDNLYVLRKKFQKINHFNIVKVGQKLQTKYIILPLEPYWVEIDQKKKEKLESIEEVVARIYHFSSEIIEEEIKDLD